ncbi:beta-ketoacyl synthase N-terminal-like domain-containing protein [Streptomyces sp. NPDC041068]|uniref:type I polyketide synthase n=1 Tax=Streptomyces sp. NPDC041068 TaxID=3155130 RepID=UPI0033C02552
MHVPDSAVAVVGLALRAPGATGPDAFWDNLVHGRVALPGRLADGTLGVGGIERTAEFDAELFGLTPTQAAVTDPQQRIVTELVWQALEDAGLDTGRDPGRVGVFLGGGDSGYRHRHVETDPTLSRAAGRQQIALGNDKDFLATSVAFRLGFTGPALTVQTACSTSLVAVHVAMRSLLTYECDIAVAGGVTVQLPVGEGYVYREGDVLSPDGHCRPFTEGSKGTVPASGAGVVVLRRAEDASPRTRAVLLGSALNNDGADRMSMVAPSPRGQAVALGEALDVAGLKPHEIGYVETHGTGTELGDQVELSALAEVYGQGELPCALGAVKANIGHTDTAAGVLGLIKTVLSVESGTIAPTPAQDGDGPDVPLGAARFRLPRQAEAWPADRPRYAAVSSFGLGGTNAHVVLAEPSVIRHADDAREGAAHGEGDTREGAAHGKGETHGEGEGLSAPGLAVLSAATPEALGRTAASLAAAVREGGAPVSEVLGTLWHGRRQLPYRWAHVIGAGDEHAVRNELADALAKATADRGATSRPAVAALLPGQGIPLTAVGRQLRVSDPQFARDWDQLNALVREKGGPDLEGCWDWPEDDPRWLRTDIVQPLLFAVELALLRLLERQGAAPDVLLGHSVGELVAATWAGVFTEADGAAAVIERGRLMGQAAPGAMTSVRTDERTARELADGLPVDVCAVNAADNVVLGGDVEQVAEVERRCAERGVGHRRLPTAHAFHSRSMARAAEGFTAFLRDVPLHAPRSTVLSNLSGEALRPQEATDPAYWGRQLGSAVRFAEALETLLADRPDVVVEAGPGHGFASQLRRGLRESERRPLIAALLSAPRRDEAYAHLAALGVAWTAGCPVADPVEPPVTAARIPGYVFSDTHHWAGGTPKGDTPASPHTAPADTAQPSPTAVDDADTPLADTPLEEGGEAGDQSAADLAALWQESFGGPAITADDNFFELGGTSLQAAQLITVIGDQFLIDVRLADLYEHSTFGDFTARIRELLDQRDDGELLALLAELETEGAEPGDDEGERTA